MTTQVAAVEQLVSQLQALTPQIETALRLGQDVQIVLRVSKHGQAGGAKLTLTQGVL